MTSINFLFSNFSRILSDSFLNKNKLFTFEKKYQSRVLSKLCERIFTSLRIKSCLLKSIALSQILRINNTKHKIMIGTCLDKHNFSSHSWIDILENRKFLKEYKVIKTIDYE